MHLVTKNGTRLFTQEITDSIAVELSEGKSTLYDVRHRESMEAFANEYTKSVQSPSRLIDDYSTNESELKAIFEGYPTAVMKVKDNNVNMDTLLQMTNTLNKASSTQRFQPVIGENSERFIIERTTARKIDMGLVLVTMEKIIQPMLMKVS